LNKKRKIIGIDASNLIYGGGRTHIVEILESLNNNIIDIDKIIIWGSENTLSLISDYSWLEKRVIPLLKNGIFIRSFWQTFVLSKLAKAEKCDILYVPSGIYLGSFKPFVTMSRNLIPFEKKELMRYGYSIITLRLLLLKYVQILTFRRANGIIFLTNYAHQIVKKYIGKVKAVIKVIPHGVNDKFRPQTSNNISDIFSDTRPFVITYVSHVEIYKHQWKVIEAIHTLRFIGIPIILNLVGSLGTKNAVKLYKEAVRKYDPNLKWIKFHGPIPYNNLNTIYQKTDIAIFASSCENMPNTLLEMMASGMPIACSDMGPMPEILKGNGLYFNPENPLDISKQIFQYYNNYILRKNYSKKCILEVEKYSWTTCARNTFLFLDHVFIHFKK
jgi:glycosyltransferase involved in cell wall biosynthesis